MSADRIPTALELHVLMDRIPGVNIPCIMCGGRGHYPGVRDYWMQCVPCNGLGEEPPGVIRDRLASEEAT